MSTDKLNNITYWIKENIIQNPDIMLNPIFRGLNEDWSYNEDMSIDLVEIITSLHNELYKEVTGNYYDYYFHWANHIGSDIHEDHIFEKADDYTKIPNYKED